MDPLLAPTLIGTLVIVAVMYVIRRWHLGHW